MKNIIILGCARSGTSMIAGTLANAGYYMGKINLKINKQFNPKGFYEGEEIININESILEPIAPKSIVLPSVNFLRIPNMVIFKNRPKKWQLWLTKIPLYARLPNSKTIVNKIKDLVKNQPYCFKDPRFSYTLPVWRPFIKNVVYICVFRDPSSTVESILRYRKNRNLIDKETAIEITWKDALKVWELMYEHILEKHCEKGEWLFIHYNQVFDNSSLELLKNFTGAQIDHTFPEKRFITSYLDRTVSKKSMQIYKRLCKLSNYNI